MVLQKTMPSPIPPHRRNFQRGPEESHLLLDGRSAIAATTLRREFERFDLRMSQAAMQEYLRCEYEQHGLNRVLDLLWEWEACVGYFSPARLQQNRRYSYEDAETGVTFRAQINFARNKYSPTPATSSATRALHCAICYDNLDLPGKENLRVFKFTLNQGREYFVQVTPFPLFEKHFVVITMETLPMQMSRQSLEDLLCFVELAPGYTGCSNSDVEWAGASILAHHHYQVFEGLDLPIMHACVLPEYSIAEESLSVGLLHFPIACCRVTSRQRALFLSVCGKMIERWKQLEPGKNTCNLVVTQNEAGYCCHILFRNPAFRTAQELLAIKSEGVGVVEVAGEGIYPVPEGDNAAAIWAKIEHEGLNVIKSIIASNNPVPQKDFGKLFEMMRTVVEEGAAL